MKRKITYISGTRADYGLMVETLKKLKSDEDIELNIIATGMHLMDEFGNTVEEIKKEGFNVDEIKAIFKEDNESSMSEYVGNLIILLTEFFKNNKPDIILLLGDRGEMLAGAIVGTYLNIATAHIHGGDVSSTVDDYVRHAITKLSNIHLAASEQSLNRIIKMGEEKDKVFLVGAPGLDEVLSKDLISKEYLYNKYNLSEDKPIILIVQHPVSLEINDSKKQIRNTLDSVAELNDRDNGDFQVILVYPNSDAGGRAMIKAIEEFKASYSNHLNLKTYKNINHSDFLGLMNIADVMIGNSSSGLIEAPSFKLPVVNIGTRQYGRERAINVIDVDYDKKEIKDAISKSLNNEEFKESLKDLKNPYGDGKSSEKILNILKTIEINDDLLNKKMQL